MTKPNKISLNCKKSSFLAIIFWVVASINAFGQVEQDRNIPELPKNIDNSGNFENPESVVADQKSDNFYRSTAVKNRNQNPSPQRKENPILKQGGEKDTKKEGMSTLSFNLFLYVVDKFKED
jgi:hypothetical protein